MGGVNLQPDHAGCHGGRETKDVREVGIERNENSAAFDSKRSDCLVRFPAEPGLCDSDGIIPVLSENRRLLRRQIFVRQKLHEARTISSLASQAAYCQAAAMWSFANCG